jgi:tetratricopeptide (TPR) repeat protein
MYMRGRKWNMRQPRRFPNLWRLLVLGLIAAFLYYVNQVVQPLSPSLFLPSPTPTLSPEVYISEAENLASQGKYAQALAEYQKAIKTDPQNPANYIASARLNAFSGNYAGAISDASNALLLAPNSSQAEAIKGFALGFSGEYLSAESSLKRAIELDPSNASAYAYLAIVYSQQIIIGEGALGNLDQAIEVSRKAESIAPNALESHWARGVVLEITGNYEEAIVEYDAAVVQNANIAELHMALGRNYRTLERYDRAVEEFTKANALNPADPLPDTYISRTYASVGEFGKAIQYAEQAVNDTPADAFMYGNLGSLYFRNRQYESALYVLRLAIRGGTTPEGVAVEGLPLAPGRVGEYYYNYALTLMRLGYCEEAVEIAQAIKQSLIDDEIAVYNAQFAIDNCISALSSGLPEPTMIPTPTARATATPSRESTAPEAGGG